MLKIDQKKEHTDSKLCSESNYLLIQSSNSFIIILWDSYSLDFSTTLDVFFKKQIFKISIVFLKWASPKSFNIKDSIVFR